MVDIGRKIRRLRMECRLTQDQLAGLAKCTKQAISHYEHGRRTPDYQQLEAICHALNVKMDTFLSSEEQSKLMLSTMSANMAAEQQRAEEERWENELIVQFRLLPHASKELLKSIADTLSAQAERSR